MIDPFLERLFAQRAYPPDLLLMYIFAGILAGLTRLIIRDNSHAKFKQWWGDGSLLGAVIISIVGAVLVDNNFVWAFLGGYFITYILEYIQRGLDKVIKRGDTSNDKI